MIRVRDLVDIADPDFEERQGEIFLCLDCGGESGGTRGDFFMLSDDDELRCPYCGGELELVRKVCKYVSVKRKK
jgi:DNA-directed RNA polymerase subunit RPC12/RpoP